MKKINKKKLLARDNNIILAFKKEICLKTKVVESKKLYKKNKFKNFD